MIEALADMQELSDESISAIHHALRSTRRRYVVLLVANRALHPSNTSGENALGESASPYLRTVSVRDLAREIVCFEENVSKENASGPPYHNVYSALIQSHLPRLDDIGAIQYDEERKFVQPDENLAALATIAAISSPVAQMLFHSAVADLFAGGSIQPGGAIGD